MLVRPQNIEVGPLVRRNRAWRECQPVTCHQLAVTSCRSVWKHVSYNIDNKMRVMLLAALCAAALGAQTSRDPEVIRAELEVARLQAMVEAGVVARAHLESAEQALTEAKEDAYLRHTLYSRDFTEEQADAVVALAARRLARREQALSHRQELVNLGAAARLTVTPFQEQADWARKEYDYAVSRAKLIHDMAAMAQAEAALAAKLESAPAEARGLAERYDGNGSFTPRDFESLNRAFERAFSKSLPVSANGDTAVHRALGFDHRNRVDVALSPDQPEGAWLREYLLAHHIPFFAFRSAVPGKATGPHIHLGPMSGRLAQGG